MLDIAELFYVEPYVARNPFEEFVDELYRINSNDAILLDQDVVDIISRIYVDRFSPNTVFFYTRTPQSFSKLQSKIDVLFTYEHRKQPEKPTSYSVYDSKPCAYLWVNTYFNMDNGILGRMKYDVDSVIEKFRELINDAERHQKKSNLEASNHIIHALRVNSEQDIEDCNKFISKNLFLFERNLEQKLDKIINVLNKSSRSVEKY